MKLCMCVCACNGGYELVSTAGESVSGDGDAGASLPPGGAMRFSRGQTESPQRPRSVSPQGNNATEL